MQGRDTAPGRDTEQDKKWDTGRDIVKDRVREPGIDTAKGRDTGRGTSRDTEWETVRDRGRDKGNY